MRLVWIIACLFWLAPASAEDEGLLVAVASNFAPTLSQISEGFTAAHGTPVRISSGSSGKLYAQIRNGAPYDLFLSADERRPELLEQEGLAVPGSRSSYAIGRLLLWSGDPALADADCPEALADDTRARLAIANPRTAPYGAAALQFLDSSGLAEAYAKRLVTGENISQAMQFAVSGGARFGLLALAQQAALPGDGCTWLVPASLHQPIRQQVVVLDRARDNAVAIAFLDYLRDDARSVIREAGYETPDE